MFDTLKQFIGLVGVTVELEVEPYPPSSEPVLRGVVHLRAKREQQISEVKVTLVCEVHQSGGRHSYHVKSKLGEVTVIPTPSLIKAGEARSLSFALPFKSPPSRANEGSVFGMIAGVSKPFSQRQEYYSAIVKAKVKGAARHPHDRKKLWGD